MKGLGWVVGLAAVGVAAEARAQESLPLPLYCGQIAATLTGDAQSTIAVACPEGCGGGPVLGANIYGSITDICSAAIQDGVLTADGGTTTVRLIPADKDGGGLGFQFAEPAEGEVLPRAVAEASCESHPGQFAEGEASTVMVCQSQVDWGGGLRVVQYALLTGEDGVLIGASTLWDTADTACEDQCAVRRLADSGVVDVGLRTSALRLDFEVVEPSGAEACSASRLERTADLVVLGGRGWRPLVSVDLGFEERPSEAPGCTGREARQRYALDVVEAQAGVAQLERRLVDASGANTDGPDHERYVYDVARHVYEVR